MGVKGPFSKRCAGLRNTVIKRTRYYFGRVPPPRTGATSRQVSSVRGAVCDSKVRI